MKTEVEDRVKTSEDRVKTIEGARRLSLINADQMPDQTPDHPLINR
jgi:hypothetical protein